MVGGNIAGDTRVMTTAIVEYTRMGSYGPALALAPSSWRSSSFVNIVLTVVADVRPSVRRLGA